MNKPAIMVVEESQMLRERLREHLLYQEFELFGAHDRTTALNLWQLRGPVLVIIYSESEMTWDGLDLAKRMRANDKFIPIILITRQSSEARAITALKLGINDYFKWPIDYNELLDSIKRNLTFPRVSSENIQKPTQQRCPDHVLVGNSQAIQHIRAYISTVGNTDSTVLITGQTGTGKECVARQIHQCSPRSKNPLVCINCAALPDSLLESELFGFERGAFTGANTSYSGKLKLADGGSVFFDEIGDMSAYAQAKVLRVFENKEITPLRAKKSETVNIRVIAATNQDLKQLVAEHKFREDLYYRINVTTIHLPPLRERQVDIPLLIAHYLQVLSTKLNRDVQGITNEALQCLLHYDWPGNVRELKNILEALIVTHSSPNIMLSELPEAVRESFRPVNAPLNERDLLISTLLSTNWNKSKTAEKLHWSRMTVYRKIAKYHIDPNRRSNDTTMRSH